MSSRDLIVRSTFLTVAVAAFCAVVWALLSLSTVTANAGRWATFLALCGAAVAAGFVVIGCLRMDRLGSILVLLGLEHAAGAAGIMLTYVTYNLGRSFPLHDGFLARLDEAMGFHWPSMLQWFEAHPALADLLAPCYLAFLPQQPIIVVALVLAARCREAQVIFLAALVGLALTHAIAFFLPASGAYGYYGILPAQHPSIGLVSAGLTVPEHAMVRAGALVDFDHLVPLGLITFPSYHALLAVVFAWGWWSVPYLRWPGLALNVGMLIATPLHGSHHVIDVVAGVALAVGCLAAASRMLARLEARQNASVWQDVLDWVPAR
jgi:hypothetical protein